MPTKLINFALPEFAFLDAHTHEGDLLEGRTVIQYIRTYTIMEAIALDENGELSLKDTVKTFEFEHTNAINITERHILALHFTLADEDDTDQIHQIFQKTARWYCDYLRWEDENIANEARSFGN